MSLFEVIVCKLRKFTLFRRLRTEVCSSQQNNVSDKGAVKEVALQLNRTLKGQAVSLLPSILSDHWSIDDCRDAILRWADELQHLQLKAEQTQAEPNTSYSRPVERRMVSPSSSPNDREEERLREAQLTLKQWANSLKALPEKLSSLHVTDGSSLCASKLDPGHASQLHAALQLAKSSVLTRERDEEDGGMERKGLKQEAETGTVQPSQARSTTDTFAVSQSCGNLSDEIKERAHQQWSSDPNFRPTFSKEDGGMERKGLKQEAETETVQLSQARSSTVKITLDPKTANPTLKISADGRRVRSITFEESKEKQHAWFQRAPHKYDGWFCIQGTEGFSSGRHYWEVDVGGCSDWRIGVVKESAPRHGFTKLTTSSGYWTLRLQLGRLIALTDPITKLNQPMPRRVGVYLDMEGRQVRFFDAKQRRHMYTFQADFGNSEKIYPVLGTVDTNREVVIL